MNDPKSESNLWSEVADQQIRMPGRIPRQFVVRKFVGFILMGLGGLALAAFAFCMIALRHGMLHMNDPGVPAITPFDVTLTVALGAAGLALTAAGYWLSHPGSFPV